MISIGNLQINKLFLGNLEVAKAYLGDVQVYGSTPEPVGKYMTMTVLDGDAGTTISPTVTGTLSPNLQYRVNNGSWTDFIVGTTADIQVVAGDVVNWKGVNESGISTSDKNYMHFSISGNPVALSGNVMSLIDGVGDALVIPSDYCFYKMFSQSNVKNVSQDFLPATELTKWCYSDLFSESLLENAPELPSLTMQENCYRGMFYGCQNFTQAPVLPATTLAPYCYQGLFQKCTSLVNPPELPAMSLKDHCYFYMFSESAITITPEIKATVLAPNCCMYMFYRCMSLKTCNSLPATSLAESCYSYMFSNCSSLTTPPELPAQSLQPRCYYSMFSNCTKLAQAPVLQAISLAEHCYNYMFSNCSSLTTPPELPVQSLQPYCYKQMFSRCSKLAQAPALNSTDLAQGCYDSMFYHCTALQTPPALNATVIKDSCYYQMFYGCTNLLSAPALPGENLENHCYERMFMNCRKLAQAPVLNCTTLVDNCYKEMFSGCSALNYVKSMATEGTIKADGTAPLALQNWLNGVAASGTFEKPAAAVYVTDSPSGIPSGWTVVEERPKPEGKYMTITVDESAGETVIKPTVTGSLPNLNLQYRINNGDWTDFIVGTTADIHLTAGNFVQFKGVNESGISNSNANYLNFAISGNPVALSGNVMSLIDGVGDTLVIPNSYCFSKLFNGSKVKTVSSDFLPATTITTWCYQHMFKGCTSLVQAPELPATKLVQCCYSEMFIGCTSLTQAPVLPATKLETYCYDYMFNGCSSLNYVKCSARNNITSTSSIRRWLEGVAQTGTFVKPAGVSYKTGGSGIPAGWTIEEI